MRIRLNWIIFSVLFIFTSCIDRFQPEVDKYDGVLVVDGGITNEPGPYTVKLNRSIGVYDFDVNYEAISNAQVSISEENGPTYALAEVEQGVYQTDSSELRGVPGKSYRLQIVLADGTEYETPYEEMREPTAIGLVDAQIEYQYSLDEDAEIPGYQFYVTSPEGNYEENYYLWRCQVTYEYHADFPIAYVFAGTIEEFPNPDSFRVCWRTFDADEVFTLSTADYSTRAVNNAPILFQRIDNKIVSVRMSLLTFQYTVNKPAYTYWNAIREQIANTGSLYNTQPYQIRGNLVNPADESEPVLGYFLVASVAENRIFKDKPTDPDIELARCQIDPLALGFVLMLGPEFWPVYISDEGVTGVLPEDGCIDCREIGGTIVKPDFWID